MIKTLVEDKMQYAVTVSEFTKTGNKPDWAKISQVEQLSVTAKQNGRQTVLKFLIMALKGLNESLNVVRPMKDEQIYETAIDLMEDYYFYRLVDFSICFKNIRKGVYGKFMDRFDQETLYKMLSQYDQVRSKEIAEFNQEKKGQDQFRRSYNSGETLQDKFNQLKKKFK